ncbi:MAG: type secretion system protein VirB2 [Aliidongia sp.]|jgi:type IV secretion system protein VirB2|nr:type secretion system protein VirB2 [Aliidongia sp.]
MKFDSRFRLLYGEANQNRRLRGYLGLMAAAANAAPRAALAQTVTGGASPAAMVNNISTFILGPFGQSVAVLAIICIGLAWMFGRASLGLLAGVIGGLVIMFGAAFLGQTITGGGTAG